MSEPVGTLTFTWNPKDLEIRTYSVEKTLEPLVQQVTTLVNTKGPSKKKKGKSKRAHVLVAAVDKATQKFIEKGEEIAHENPEVKKEMLATVDEVRKTGENMRVASSEFADDPCSSAKRSNMVRAARALLSAVTRLLILADMVDVQLLIRNLKIVEADLRNIRDARSEQELANKFKAYAEDASKLNKLTGSRQADLKDAGHREKLAAARADLQKHGNVLLTSSKAYIRHPEVAAARENKEYVIKQLSDAVNTISDVAQATGKSEPDVSLAGPGELAAALEELDREVLMSPADYKEKRTRPSLEEKLEGIISAAALMADSSCTRDDTRERIIAECNNVRQALQDLLSEYMSCAGRKERTDPLDRAIERMFKKTRDLRRQLRKAVVDHISDSFLETNLPLLVLIEAAKSGNVKEVEEYAGVFQEHADKLVEVANLACSMSQNEEGVKYVRMAAQQLENLCPQVINAARILAARPRSKAALDNMEAFRQQWEKQVRLLTEAVDEITTLDDFLAVSEKHILEDVSKCNEALRERDGDKLDRCSGAIRGRSSRVCHVVESEMQNYVPSQYTDRVLRAVDSLRDQVMPRFAREVENSVDALTSQPPGHVDDNEFMDAAKMVYDGVREIRRAVLVNRDDDEDLPSDADELYDDSVSGFAHKVAGDHYDQYGSELERAAQARYGAAHGGMGRDEDEGRYLYGPDGRPIIGPDGRPLFIAPDGALVDSQGRPITIDNNGYLVDAEGRPICGPDGKPIMIDPQGRLLTSDGYALVGPDNKPVMMGEDGRLYGSDGRPLISITQDGRLVGADGKALPIGAGGAVIGAYGRPIMTADGHPLTIAADGKLLDPEGRPISIDSNGRLVGPDGRPILGADGKPMYVDSQGRLLGSDGRPIIGLDGRPIMISADGMLLGADGRPITGWQKFDPLRAPGGWQPYVESDDWSKADQNRDRSRHAEKKVQDTEPEVTREEILAQFTEAEKQQIQIQVEEFELEKEKFEKQVIYQWDDTGNDIIIMAKQMCMIMMEMTDFTRGRGPLKTTMDVIHAARRIADLGSKLDKLARTIADMCPDSTSKDDLIAYLQRIALYCHQLNICSKVKAGVQSVSGELVVSALDSATSLIQAAKNLMSAVVQTVKASYVASTKYSRHGGSVKSPVVLWKMKAPDKKPLVKRESPDEMKAKIHKAPKKKDINIVQELNEFKGSDSFSSV
ncbi:catenin alpha-2-like isoform X2 [Ptychodera flava]|uniref:catenin alpha-2-like isoform X2 n=1 Tax=Ptychodera flava TaxID=63121 RepID=UPI00396A1060